MQQYIYLQIEFLQKCSKKRKNLIDTNEFFSFREAPRFTGESSSQLAIDLVHYFHNSIKIIKQYTLTMNLVSMSPNQTSPNSLLKHKSKENYKTVDDPQFPRDGVSTRILIAYSVGHFANDLCASLWFIYLNYYLVYVVNVSVNVAGLALLSGQITDGITTPIVGLASDRLSCSVGKRNAWYYSGSLLVIPSFLCIFLNLNLSGSVETVWYITWPAIFNVGWAAVQISHMAIVNNISYSQKKRDQMVVTRNSFTYAANIFALAFSLMLFVFVKNCTLQFRILALTCIVVGSCTTLFYVCNVFEPTLSKKALQSQMSLRKDLEKSNAADLLKSREKERSTDQGKTSTMWLQEAQFYIFGGVYMSARIALNSTATMLPLYLVSVTQFQPRPGFATSPVIASVPLVQYICSLIFSMFLQQRVTRGFESRLASMVLAVVATVGGSVPLIFLCNEDRQYVYPCVALQGIGIALMLNTGTSLISDMIGTDTRSSAFIYGAYSLLDKFANGFLLWFLVKNYSKDPYCLSIIMAFVPTVAAVTCASLTKIGIAMQARDPAKQVILSLKTKRAREDAQQVSLLEDQK